MHIVVMGCGRVGSSLANRTAALGHSVAVIDQNADAFRRLGEDFSGNTVAGMGFDQDTLLQAGIDHADAFAAVSSGDNSNIISARVARETFNVQRVVARIYDPRRAEIFERLGIPTIATVPWTTNRLMRAMLGETLEETWRDPSGAVAVVQVRPNEGWIGYSVRDFESAAAGRVGMITRFGKGEVPTESTVMQDGDLVYVFIEDEYRAGLSSVVENPPEA